MNYHEAAYCGDFCGACENYQKTCTGCDPKYKPDCVFIGCCREHSAAHCGLCEEFPCERLEAFVPHDSAGCPPGYHIANLRHRAIVGTEDWLRVQRGRCGLAVEGRAEEVEIGGG